MKQNYNRTFKKRQTLWSSSNGFLIPITIIKVRLCIMIIVVILVIHRQALEDEHNFRVLSCLQDYMGLP